MQNNENDLLLKRSEYPHVLISKADISVYKDVISNLESDVEHIMFFNSGTKADLVESVKPYDTRFSNFLGLYVPEIHDAFVEVRSMLLDICKHHDINYSKSSYYMSSDYINLSGDFWYDGGGLRIPAFNGFIIVDCESNTKVNISKTINVVNPGDILLFEAGHRVAFGNSNSLVISFNVAPLSMLNGQYPNKWIPL